MFRRKCAKIGAARAPIAKNWVFGGALSTL